MLARANSEEFRLVQRARIIIWRQSGASVTELVKAGHGQPRTVQRWIERYRTQPGCASLEDRPRSGRPRVFDGAVRQKVIAFVCQYPDEHGLIGLTHWSLRRIQRLMPGFLGEELTMSHETIRRILDAATLQPHRVKYYLQRTDPEFFSKALAIIRLYDHHRLDPDAFDLVCIDELSGLQALQRRHPRRPMLPGSPERRAFEYIRYGTRCLLAGFDVATGLVFGQVYPDRKRTTFLSFLDELIRWRSDKELHLILDNLNTHKGPDIDQWLARQLGRVHLHYTPFHGSWLNLIEIWFGILKDQCIARGDFHGGDDLTVKIMNFTHLWNYFFAHPFTWRFTEHKFLEWYERKYGSLRLAA